MKNDQDNIFSKELLDAFLADNDSDNDEISSTSRTSNLNKSQQFNLQHNDEHKNLQSIGIASQQQKDKTSTITTSDETAIASAIKTLIDIQSSTLLTNPLNYYGYLQGQVIERISASIVDLLLIAYKGEVQTAQDFFNQSVDRFSKNRDDWNFVENHVLNLIERIYQLKMNGIKKRIKSDEIFIPFVTVSQSVYSTKRRFPYTAIESERIKNARKKQLRTIRNLNSNATISDEIWETKRKRRQNKIDSCFEAKAKRFLQDDKPLPEFDFSLELGDSANESLLRTTNHEASTVSSNMDPRRAHFATKVNVISNSDDIDDSFEELTREIMLNISQVTAPVVSPFNVSGTISRRVITPEETARRRQLREQMSVHINAQPPIFVQCSPHAGAAGTRQQMMRQTEHLIKQDIRKVDRPTVINHQSICNSQRSLSDSDGNIMKRTKVQKSKSISYSGDRLAESVWKHSNEFYTDKEHSIENDHFSNDSDTNDESTDLRFSNENYDKHIGSVIIAPLIHELRSCLSPKMFFRPGTKKRVQYSEQGHSVVEYQLDDNTSNNLRCTVEKGSHTCPIKTTRFTRKTSFVLPPKNSNLTVLPHLNSPTPIFKRTDPRLLPLVTLQQYYAELRMLVDQLCAHANSKSNLSRWLICDTLLSELEDTVLKNAHTTRIEFPRLPTWLISEGMADYVMSFPINITRIFVCCGYDIELLHSDDESYIAMDFVRNLYEWMSINVARRFMRPEGVEWRESCYCLMPIIVLINVPEVGNFKRQFRVFNEKMKKFVHNMNNRDEAVTHGLIEIVDWAGLVKSCSDVKSMQTVEGRIALLIRELNKEHGLLIY